MRKFVPSITTVDSQPLSPTADQLLPAVLDSHVPEAAGPPLQAFGVK